MLCFLKHPSQNATYISKNLQWPPIALQINKVLNLFAWHLRLSIILYCLPSLSHHPWVVLQLIVSYLIQMCCFCYTVPATWKTLSIHIPLHFNCWGNLIHHSRLYSNAFSSMKPSLSLSVRVKHSYPSALPVAYLFNIFSSPYTQSRLLVNTH